MTFRAHANAMPRFSFSPADLAPGDTSSAALDTAEITIDSVHSLDDPLFALAYARMWEQFGAAHEVESRDVLGRRLAWDASRPRDGFAMGYDLLLVRHGGKFAAVRDHAAIADADERPRVVEHIAVAGPHSRGGLRCSPLLLGDHSGDQGLGLALDARHPILLNSAMP